MPPRNFLDGIDQNKIVSRRSRSLSPTKLQISPSSKPEIDDNAASPITSPSQSPPVISTRLILATVETVKPKHLSTQNEKPNWYKLLVDLNSILPPPHTTTTNTITSSLNKKVDISKMINDAITEAFKKLQTSISNSNLSHQTDLKFKIPARPAINVPPHPDPNLVPQPNYSQSRNLYQHNDIPIPIIDKYDGQTDVLEYLEDLETRF
ncbi:hypothetical protein GcM1_078002 [Golovinomyces cichoracearum]|uniref:Uncharacterized protein n=1 Tax=Golovinomyces cichoracearum TaxID=62708 RepID=A0A420JC98_9PEZI|nr:hypothetical protein GcM1_078002 [Golovinomyces cichoracearum]